MIIIIIIIHKTFVHCDPHCSEPAIFDTYNTNEIAPGVKVSAQKWTHTTHSHVRTHAHRHWHSQPKKNVCAILGKNTNKTLATHFSIVRSSPVCSISSRAHAENSHSHVSRTQIRTYTLALASMGRIRPPHHRTRRI